MEKKFIEQNSDFEAESAVSVCVRRERPDSRIHSHGHGVCYAVEVMSPRPYIFSETNSVYLYGRRVCSQRWWRSLLVYRMADRWS